VNGLGMSGEVTAADLDALEAFYKARGCDTRLRICPLADESVLKELGKRNYRIEMFLNSHFREIPEFEVLPEPDPTIEVRRLGIADEDLWLQMNLGGFQYDPEWMKDITRATLHSPHVHCLLASVDGKPAGNSALSIHGDIAGMHNTSVLPEFRSRGIQTALINYRLRLAQSLGCNLIIVETTPGNNSQRNIERAGFRIAYTGVTLVKPH
jgi:GNAT superfamily N-acetyltransferase